MSEKEKMLNGEPYIPKGDKELSLEINNCKNLCFTYNSIHPSKNKEREEFIKKIFGKTKKFVTVESDFYCDYGYNIEVGENFYMNHNCVILDCAKVEFGDNVFIGPNCGFYTAFHPLQAEKRFFGIEQAKPIKIGNDVWIGGNVTVLPGVTIGDKAVIGAGSVVTKDIPSNVLAVGNPCKPVKDINQND